MKEQDIHAALDALTELANTPMELSMADWCRICSTIRAALTDLPDLIRVIELAEDALKSCYFRAHDEMDYDSDLVEKALSEIEKSIVGV